MNYINGDVIRHLKDRPAPWALLHIVNDQGGWGRGITGQISQHISPFYERVYRDWYRSRHASEGLPFELGRVSFARQVEKTVVHLLAQQGYSKPGRPAVDLGALEECLRRAALALPRSMPIHLPQIGCGLGGRTWGEVEPLVTGHFGNHDNVTVWRFRVGEK